MPLLLYLPLNDLYVCHCYYNFLSMICVSAIVVITLSQTINRCLSGSYFRQGQLGTHCLHLFQLYDLQKWPRWLIRYCRTTEESYSNSWQGKRFLPFPKRLDQFGALQLLFSGYRGIFLRRERDWDMNQTLTSIL
jgi:hypothetical protein